MTKNKRTAAACAWHRTKAHARVRFTIQKLRRNLDRPLVLGFWINRSEILSAAAVAPDAVFVRFGFLSRDHCWTRREVRALLEHVAAMTEAVEPEVIVWGIRDRVAGFDLTEMFPRVRRIEVGLLRGLPHWRLKTRFMVEDRGIYFDGREASETETALQSLRPGYAARSETARALLDHVRHNSVTKYVLSDGGADLEPGSLLILGQVNGDQALVNAVSIAHTNADFIALLHAERPPAMAGSSRVYYKPHPMNRRDNEAEIASVKAAFPHIDVIGPSVNVHNLFEQRPRVATMTSGAGLEAVLHGCEVHTFGIPFYSHWGFTVDHYDCARRTNRLSAEDVAALMWIDRTVYVDPATRRPISAAAVFGLG